MHDIVQFVNYQSMHHLEALALIFFQSKLTNFVVQMNNFTSRRILHLRNRVALASRSATPHARLRKETHHGNSPPR